MKRPVVRAKVVRAKEATLFLIAHCSPEMHSVPLSAPSELPEY